MPREFSKCSHKFWNGETGRNIRGDAATQLVCMYLLTCGASNMLGLYQIGIPTIMHEIGLPFEGASKALRRASEEDFAHYDNRSEYVWVVEMAYWQVAPELKADDNRIKGIIKDLDTNHRKSPFFNAFVNKYKSIFRLDGLELNTASAVKNVSPFEAPSKPRDRDRAGDRERTGDSVGKPRKRVRATVPDPFEVSPEMAKWAAEEGLTGQDIDRETQKMIDWAKSKDEMKVDWLATWRNWLRKSIEMRQKGNGNGKLPYNRESYSESVGRSNRESAERVASRVAALSSGNGEGHQG